MELEKSTKVDPLGSVQNSNQPKKTDLIFENFVNMTIGWLEFFKRLEYDNKDGDEQCKYVKKGT